MLLLGRQAAAAATVRGVGGAMGAPVMRVAAAGMATKAAGGGGQKKVKTARKKEDGRREVQAVEAARAPPAACLSSEVVLERMVRLLKNGFQEVGNAQKGSGALNVYGRTESCVFDDRLPHEQWGQFHLHKDLRLDADLRARLRETVEREFRIQIPREDWAAGVLRVQDVVDLVSANPHARPSYVSYVVNPRA